MESNCFRTFPIGWKAPEKPTVRDTRVAVEHVLAMLADGATTDQILEEYSFLEAEDIRACLAYAWRLVSQEEIETIPRSTAG